MIKSYKDLEIWKKSVELVKDIYINTKDFPKSETYALVDQIRRASLSIPSNIAERDTPDSIKESLSSFYSLHWVLWQNLKLN